MAKAKSAYSTPGKLGKLGTHIIVVWVDNEAGVLARVVGLFSGRGYNIESLAVALSELVTATRCCTELLSHVRSQAWKEHRHGWP